MSNLKTVKNFAKAAYKKVPKKELVNKVAAFGAKQVIGSTYLDVLSFLYKKTKKKAISYAGSYAYDSFLRSKFARGKLNSLPMSLMAFIVRSLTNFLIFSRLATGVRILDIIMSMIITIITTLLTPFFYTSIKAHEELFLHYTNSFVDHFMGPGGWEYVEEIKNRMLLFIGLLFLIVLQFIEVNSRYLQEMILHALITGFVSDRIQRWIDSFPETKRLYYGIVGPDEYVLTPRNFVNNCRRVNICHTDNRVIIGGKKLKRAKIVPHDKLKNYIIPNSDTPDIPSNQELKCVDIVENYNADRIKNKELVNLIEISPKS